MKYLGWFSCGATSAVACKIAIDEGLEVDLWYLYTGAEHSDNERFIADCEKWYGKKINIARSNKFSCPDDVARKELFNTPYGAPCTKYLKKEVRQKQIMPLYEGQEVCHILGFEYTQHEVNRAKLEVETKHTILKQNGQQLYLKDLPVDKGYHTDLDIPSCDLFCDLEMDGLPILELEEARNKLF